MGIVCFLLSIAFYGIIVWVILSYVVNFGRLPWGHPVRRVYDAIDRAIRPVLSPIRSVLPPVRAGAMALDLSPLVLMLIIAVLRGFVC